ncbi:hypothetical protein [Amycolatopsis balhimycina]|nr:hypothetical protein [Amycolatopsis balhimycina]
MLVLLVEDDQPIADSLRRGLVRDGYWVRTGAEALTESADIVLLP